MSKLEEKKLTINNLESIEDKYNDIVNENNNIKLTNERITNEINDYISKLNENEHIISKYEQDNSTLHILIKEYILLYCNM